MPPLAPREIKSSSKDKKIAIMAEALYLANLLLLPVVAFLLLLVLYFRNGKSSIDGLSACHLRQTLSASIWAGIILIVFIAGVFLLGGFDSAATWVVVILYFTVIHAAFVLLGALGLARAMSGKHFHFPLVGRSCLE